MPRLARGFTFIELLIVIVILGLLAALALPRLVPLSDKGRTAALQSDVRNAEFAEEAYFADAGTYATIDQLQTAGTLKVSPGVTLTVSPSSTGYTVQATNPSISKGPNTCHVQLGGGATVDVDGKIICE